MYEYWLNTLLPWEFSICLYLVHIGRPQNKHKYGLIWTNMYLFGNSKKKKNTAQAWRSDSPAAWHARKRRDSRLPRVWCVSIFDCIQVVGETWILVQYGSLLTNMNHICTYFDTYWPIQIQAQIWAYIDQYASIWIKYICMFQYGTYVCSYVCCCMFMYVHTYVCSNMVCCKFNCAYLVTKYGQNMSINIDKYRPELCSSFQHQYSWTLEDWTNPTKCMCIWLMFACTGMYAYILVDVCIHACWACLVLPFQILTDTAQ